MDEDIGTSVELYIYDMTKGLAKMLSGVLLGQELEGIWHTGVVAYGREYFFGATGIQSCNPGGTILGEPSKVENLGETQIPYQIFLEYVLGLGESKYRPDSYNLLRHNCNNFSDDVSSFLCGRNIPKYIIDLPTEILNTPLGQTVAPLLSGLTLQAESSRGVAFGAAANHNLANYVPTSPPTGRQKSPEFEQLNEAIEEIRRDSQAIDDQRNTTNEKIQKREKKKKKKRKDKSEAISNSADNSPGRSSEFYFAPTGVMSTMSEVTENPPSARNGEGADPPRPLPPREPPVIFRDKIDAKVEFTALEKMISGSLAEEDVVSLSELRQYIIDDEGSWALGDNFMAFLGKILHDKLRSPEQRVKLLRVLAGAALKDDAILILHQDRREHILMSYANDADRLPLEEQEALGLMFSNLFEHSSSSEWLLYISEWAGKDGQQLSNIRVTTKVAVNSLLGDVPALQNYGSAIMHNLAVKEKLKTNVDMRKMMPEGSLSKVFDDVATELAMAILQYFNGNPPEELVFRCMKALAKFCQISYNDVPALIKMIGPEPAKFAGLSERVDQLVQVIQAKLASIPDM